VTVIGFADSTFLEIDSGNKESQMLFYPKSIRMKTIKQFLWNLTFLNFSFILFTSCTMVKSKENPDFIIANSYYQSWMKNENEKGTTVVIEVRKSKEGVVFDSLIFNHKKIPVFSMKNKQSLILKGVINSPTSSLPMKITVVNEPDQLIYHYQGERKLVKLNNIHRKDMKYY
jgi:hypothetical protein